MIDGVKTLTVADAVVEKLLEYISTGKLVWGQQLPAQRELAKMLNVGVSSVREALQILQAMGFVVIKRGQGTYITENSAEPLLKNLTNSIYQNTDIQELMEVREVLDTGLAVLAAKKADSTALKIMESCIDGMKKNYEQDSSLSAKSDMDFHIALAQSVNNPILEKFSYAIRSLYEEFLGEVAHTKGGIELHSRVLNAVKESNPIGARDAMIELLKHTRQIYLEEHYKRGNNEKGTG
jgi:GntR family transcriptional regulator, transcriptional repressor for pyruvate dehydrogenase complex